MLYIELKKQKNNNYATFYSTFTYQTYQINSIYYAYCRKYSILLISFSAYLVDSRLQEIIKMIRPYNKEDMNCVLDIWLSASIKAHDFITKDYWISQVGDMENIYLPNSESYVFEQNRDVIGFYSLYGNHLAAIFVSTKEQSQGIGTMLITHAKQQRKQLSLSVYKENEASYQFYLKQGFTITSEQVDKHTGHTEFTMALS